MNRTGWGYDVHRFGGSAALRLGGVEIPGAPGLEATSDGDVAAHAATDAILGACALGDLGTHFPPGDDRFEGADSIELLTQATRLVRSAGFDVVSLDVTVIAESVRIAPHREAMRACLAAAVGVDVGRVSVKATTTDGLGHIGAGEGIAAAAIATVAQS